MPAFFNATAALSPPIPAPITSAFILLSFICLKSSAICVPGCPQTRKSRVNRAMHHFVALLLCVFALVLPFCESKISL
jgi:hypothetical protein